MRHLSETLTSGAKATHWSQHHHLSDPGNNSELTFMTYDGSEYLVIIDYYSKMPIVRKMPTSQCNSAKTITVLKELFAEHGESQKRSDQTMDPSLQVTSLQNSLRTGTLSTVHLHQGNPGAMDKQSLQSRLSKVCLPVPNALDRIHILLC